MVYAVATTVTSEVQAPILNSRVQPLRAPAVAADTRSACSAAPGVRLGGFGRFGPEDDLHEIAEEIGCGAAARVFACQRIRTGEDLAVKVINLQWLQLRGDRRKEMEKLNREVEILKRLRHPRIVNLRMAYWTGNWFYLVMERVWGGELFQTIAKTRGLKEFEARYVFQQLLDGLCYIHKQGVVHRDLKPENILVCDSRPALPPASGNLYDVKIVDFGLSKHIVEGASLCKSFVGTPQYWAPEVLKCSEGGGSSYGPEADLWGLGAVLFVMLCGKYPFDGKKQPLEEQIRTASFNLSTSRWRPVSLEAKDLVRGLMKVAPMDRLSLDASFHHAWVVSEQRAASEIIKSTCEVPSKGETSKSSPEDASEITKLTCAVPRKRETSKHSPEDSDEEQVQLEQSESITSEVAQQYRRWWSCAWVTKGILFGILISVCVYLSCSNCGIMKGPRHQDSLDAAISHQLIRRPAELPLEQLLGGQAASVDLRRGMSTKPMAECPLSDHCPSLPALVDLHAPKQFSVNVVGSSSALWPSTVPLEPQKMSCEERRAFLCASELLKLQISIVGFLKQASIALGHADMDLAEATQATLRQAQEVFHAANTVVGGYSSVANRVQEVLPDLHLAVEEKAPKMAANLLAVVKQWVRDMRTNGDATRQKYVELHKSVLSLAQQVQRRKNSADQHLFEAMKALRIEGVRGGLVINEGKVARTQSDDPPTQMPLGTEKQNIGKTTGDNEGIHVCTSFEVEDNVAASHRLNECTEQLFKLLGELAPGELNGSERAEPEVPNLLFRTEGIGADFPTHDVERQTMAAASLDHVVLSMTRVSNESKSAQSRASLLRALRQVDSILEGCISFWTNMDRTLLKLHQMLETTEASVDYATHSARLKERFQQRLHEYTQFWAWLGRISKQYSNDHYAATAVMNKWINESEAALAPPL